MKIMAVYSTSMNYTRPGQKWLHKMRENSSFWKDASKEPVLLMHCPDKCSFSGLLCSAIVKALKSLGMKSGFLMEEIKPEDVAKYANIPKFQVEKPEVNKMSCHINKS